MLDFTTITGADDKVSVDELLTLSKDFDVEWAILLSQARMGENRYPTWKWIRSLLEIREQNPDMKISCHLCGKWVRDIEDGNFSVIEAMKQEGCNPLLFDRFQINWGSRGGKADLDKLHAAFSSLNDPNYWDYILQCPNGNCSSLETISGHLQNLGDIRFAPLFDSSGGKGIVRSEWPKPWGPFCGYAGGLNPENLKDEYTKIASQAKKVPIWIDVESGVRDSENEFDLQKVKSFLEIASSFYSEVDAHKAKAGTEVEGNSSAKNTLTTKNN